MINRTKELETLADMAGNPNKSLGLVYGRRRVGKTFLLQNAWADTIPVFYFLASETTPEVNRIDLLNELAFFSGTSYQREDYPTWRTVFRELLNVNQPSVVVLDEFQFLMGGEDDALSQLSAVWDALPLATPVTVILSGSAVRTMASIQDSGSPLYGRLDWHKQLRPFQYQHAGELSGCSALRDRAYAYGIYGGMPRYLASIDPRKSLDKSVVRSILDPSGDIRHLIETSIEQEGGLRKTGAYRAVITAIANGHRTLAGISNYTGLEYGTPLRAMVNTLIELDFVEAETNLGAKKNSAIRYVLSDPAIRYNTSEVSRFRNELQTSDPAKVWRSTMKPRLDTYMGRVFEKMVKQAYTQVKSTNLVSEWTRWEGVDRNRKSLEMDVVVRLTKGGLLTGAIKWNKKPCGPNLHLQHMRDLQRLAVSGHGWANEALQPRSSLLYVSAAGFTEDFELIASAEGHDLTLWSLEDLYN